MGCLMFHGGCRGSASSVAIPRSLLCINAVMWRQWDALKTQAMLLMSRLCRQWFKSHFCPSVTTSRKLKEKVLRCLFFGVYPRCVWVGAEQPASSSTRLWSFLSYPEAKYLFTRCCFSLFWETWASCFQNKVVVENKSLIIESLPGTERKETQKCQWVISGIRTQLT